jgi:hypothetical protein
VKRGLAIGVLCVALAAGGVAVAALLPEQPVLSTSRNERNPAADATGTTQVLAYTRSRSGEPNRYDAFAQREGEAPVKLNTSGQGWTGGIDYPMVVYQQIASGQSNIFLYDFTDGSRPPTPAGVNTSKWEWHPTMSGDWLLYGRDNTSNPTQRVVLHNQVTHAERTLDSITKASQYLQPDQVRGDWATFTKCAPNCNVFRHQISTNTTMRMPRPTTDRPRQQYAGGVAPDGDVYLVRSGPRCGEKVRIVRYDPDQADGTFGTIIASLPAGRDIAFSYVFEQFDGARDFYYDRVNCSTGKFDIFKVTDPAGP